MQLNLKPQTNNKLFTLKRKGKSEPYYNRKELFEELSGHKYVK